VAQLQIQVAPITMIAVRSSARLAILALLVPRRCYSLPGTLQSALLESVASQLDLSADAYTVSGTHFAQGYMTENATEVNAEGMQADCDNINLNMKLSSSFRSDVFSLGLKGFFYKCEKVGDRNKYWFTISSADVGSMIKLCDGNTQYPIVYDSQHDTYWRDMPFTCQGAPSYAMGFAGSAFLERVAKEMDLPDRAYTVSGTHFAQGYTTQDATVINADGMQADCDNINLNKKLSPSFRSDVFGPGLEGFFYKCEKVGDKNKYWFTITTASHSDVVKLCDVNTTYPIVYDSQHRTYWRDEPFTCIGV